MADRSATLVRSLLIAATLNLALVAMFGQALGLLPNGIGIRNAAVALLVVELLVASIVGLRSGSGLAIAVVSLAAYVGLRSLMLSEFTIVVAGQILWVPLAFIASRCITIDEQTIALWQTRLLVAFGATYVVVMYRGGLHGPQMINSVYYCLMLMPFALSLRARRTRYFGLGVLLIAILASGKMTALVAFCLGGLANLAVTRLNGGVHRGHVGRPIIFSALTMLVCLIVADHLGVDVVRDMSALRDDGGSGRAEIYDWVWGSLWASQSRVLWFGHGPDAVASMTGGLSAHNDLLEMAYDFGLIGALMYLLIFVVLLNGLLMHIRSNSMWSGPWAGSIAVFGVVSAFSHLILIPTYVAFMALFWAVFEPRAQDMRAWTASPAGGYSVESDMLTAREMRA